MTNARSTNLQRLLCAAVAVCAWVGWPGAAAGALSPATREYPIMGDLPGHQQEPRLAFGPKGGFMVWRHESGKPGSAGRLVIQPVNRGMVGMGLPSPLSQSAGGTREARPCIALLADGGAVVAWETGPRGKRDVQVRFLSASGLFTSSAITANQYAVGDQFQPAITVLAGGGVVLAWTSSGQDRSGNGIYAQRFSAGGAKVGGEFRMNEQIKWSQSEPTLAALPDGRLVAVWVSESMNGQTAQGAPNLRGNLTGRLFNARGQPTAGEYRLNQANSMCSRPVVMALGEGFIVAWEQRDEKVMSNLTDIYVRTFDKSGLPPAEEVRWNALVAGEQSRPVLAIHQGNGLLAWESYIEATKSREVHARMLSGGAEFRVNRRVQYHQQQPTVGVDSEGNFVVVWVDFAVPRNSVLTAIQYNQSNRADVTVGAHVSYQGPGASVLVLSAKTPVNKDPVANEIQRRNAVQQLTVEFNADEQSRQAALVAQAAAAAKASGLLQQMAAAAKEPAAPIVGGLAMQAPNVRRSPMAGGAVQNQGTSGIVFSNVPAGPPSTAVSPGLSMLNSAARAGLTGRAINPLSGIRHRAISPVGGRPGISGSPYRQVNRNLPQGMGRIGGYSAPQPGRSTSNWPGSLNARRSFGRGSPLRQATGTTARRVNSNGLATLRTQIAAGGRAMSAPAGSSRGQQMPTPGQSRKSRNAPVNASLVKGGGGFSIQWASRNGARYQVQKSRDSSSWVNDGPVRRGTGRSVNSSIGTGGQYRFFRVMKRQ
jgi:hypothetical protein